MKLFILLFMIVFSSFAKESRFQYVVASLSPNGQFYIIRHLYINPDIDPQSKIELHAGLRCGGHSWLQVKDYSMSPFKEDQWEVGFPIPLNINNAKCTDYEFVYKITSPNGQVIWDNTFAWPNGFYSSDLEIKFEGQRKYVLVTYGMSSVSDYQYKR